VLKPSPQCVCCWMDEDEDEDKSEHKGGSKLNSIFGSRWALIALLFSCTSMPRDLLHALSLLLGTESQGLQVASIAHILIMRIGLGRTVEDVPPRQTTKQPVLVGGQNKNPVSRCIQRHFLLEVTKLLAREHSNKPEQCLHLEEDVEEAHIPQVEEEQVISIKIDLIRSLRVRRRSKIIPTT